MRRLNVSELRFGVISEVRMSDGAARVSFEDRDSIQSYWLQPLLTKTQTAKVWWPLEIGEHVACLVDENGEAGVVLGAIYGRDPKPVGAGEKDCFIQFLNGDFVKHNSDTGDMEIKVSGRLSIKAEGDIDLQGARVMANGSPVSRIGDTDSDGDVMVTGAG